MDDMCELDSTGVDEYADKGLIMSPENLMIPILDYQNLQYHDYHSSSNIPNHPPHNQMPPPAFGSEEELAAAFQCSAAAVTSQESASANYVVQKHNKDEDDDVAISCSVIKAKIASHPSYPKLLHAYVDCQKFGAPPEIVYMLDEIMRENELTTQNDAVSSTCPLGLDPQLDQFMESYCEVLVKYKSELSRPFDEATSFLNNAHTQLLNLCNDDVLTYWSDEELSNNKEGEIDDNIKDGELLLMKTEEGQLKDKLLRMYGSHISSLKHEFSKKKKKGKLPQEARQALLQWWNLHCKWPYPTESDKIALAEETGLDQKQINNWFINQRKRHWKSPENMQLAILDNLSSHFFLQD